MLLTTRQRKILRIMLVEARFEMSLILKSPKLTRLFFYNNCLYCNLHIDFVLTNQWKNSSNHFRWVPTTDVSIEPSIRVEVHV